MEEYGIISYGSLSTLATDRESGYVFTPTKNIQLLGFRLYLPEAAKDVICRLWDTSSKAQIASCAIESVGAKAWTTGYMDLPVQLTAGTTYAISCWLTTSRYSTALSSVTFNSNITVSSGCYTAQNGAFPDTTATNIYQLIDAVFGEPYAKKYLIRSGSTLYTVSDDLLSALTETEVTASLFQAYGVEEIPDGSLLVGLTDPEILYWQDSADTLPTINLTVKGSPPMPQTIISGLHDLRHNTILGISHATVVASTDVLFAISFDDGATWLAHNGVTWYIVDNQTAGMSAERFNSVTAEQWEEVVVLESYMVRFCLPNTTAFVTSVVLHYINP